MVGKILKWMGSCLRLALLRLRRGKRLQIARGGKPVYIGKHCRIKIDAAANPF